MRKERSKVTGFLVRNKQGGRKFWNPFDKGRPVVGGAKEKGEKLGSSKPNPCVDQGKNLLALSF